MDIVARFNRFLDWLWPERTRETAACKACGEVALKRRMVHDNAYGWFCNEEELDKFWLRCQW